MNTINHSSRRKFVKNASTIAGGLLLAPMITKTNYFSGADDVIRIALIGCGGRGTGACVQALLSKQNVRLVAMADAFRDRIDSSYNILTSELSEWSGGKSGEKLDLKKVIDVPEERKFVGFDAYQKAIALADVVLLTTPPGFRPIHFEEAVKQGKHVFMEKPVATDPAGVQKVLAAAIIAKQEKLNVMVGLQRHYQNSYQELYKRRGLIGDITSAQAWWNGDGNMLQPRRAGQTEMEYQVRNWYFFVWLCGDPIIEQHMHNIDVINWFKGSHPVKAQGMGGREVRKGKSAGEIFDHHYVEFEYPDGSILNSQSRQIRGTMSRVGELMIGTKGRIDGSKARITDHAGKQLYQFDLKQENNPYQTEHDKLFAAIAKGDYTFSDAENGAYSTMTAILGRLATYSGQLIEWDKAFHSGLDLHPASYAWDALPRTLPDADGLYKGSTPGVTTFF
jgi:predicted dehydrogenase